MNLERDCFEVASAGEPVHLREFMIKRDGIIFCIKISYPAYLQELRVRNTNRPSAGQVDESIYVFDGVSSAEQFGGLNEIDICQQLSKIPFEVLRPYLTKQVSDP